MKTLKCSAFVCQKAKGLRASLGVPCMALPLYISLLLGGMPTGVQAATWKKVAVAVVIGMVGLSQSDEGMHKVPATRGELIDNVFAHGGQAGAMHTHPMHDYSVEMPAPLDTQARMMPSFEILHRLERAMEAIPPAEKTAIAAPRNLLASPYKIASVLNPIPRFAAKAAPLSANETTTSTTRVASTTYKPKGAKDFYDEVRDVEWWGWLLTGSGLMILIPTLCCWMCLADTKTCPCCTKTCYLLCCPFTFILCCHPCRNVGGGVLNGCSNFWCCKWCCRKKVPMQSDQQEMVMHGQLQAFSNEDMDAPTTLLTMPESS